MILTATWRNSCTLHPFYTRKLIASDTGSTHLDLQTGGRFGALGVTGSETAHLSLCTLWCGWETKRIESNAGSNLEANWNLQKQYFVWLQSHVEGSLWIDAVSQQKKIERDSNKKGRLIETSYLWDSTKSQKKERCFFGKRIFSERYRYWGLLD